MSEPDFFERLRQDMERRKTSSEEYWSTARGGLALLAVAVLVVACVIYTLVVA